MTNKPFRSFICPFPFKMTKVPFSLTYIQYDKEDGIVGWVMALVSLAPVYSDFGRLDHLLASLCAFCAPLSFYTGICTPSSFSSKW